MYKVLDDSLLSYCCIRDLLLSMYKVLDDTLLP